MDSWPPRESTVVKAALPAVFTGLIALTGWLWVESSRNAVARAELVRMRKELDALNGKLEGSIDGRFADNREMLQKLNDIRVTVTRIEAGLAQGRRKR